MHKTCYEISFYHGAFNFYVLKADSIGILLFPKNIVKRKRYRKSLPSNWFYHWFHFKPIVGENLEKSDL